MALFSRALCIMLGLMLVVPGESMMQCYFCTTPMECAQPLGKMAMVNCKRGCVSVFSDQSMTMATWRTCGSGRMCMNTPRVGNIPGGFMCACESDGCNGHNSSHKMAAIVSLVLTTSLLGVLFNTVISR